MEAMFGGMGPMGPGGMGGMGGMNMGAGMPRRSTRSRPARYDIMKPGTYVGIHGLSVEKHNGKQGRVVEYNDSRGRYMIQIEGEDGTQLALKRSNSQQLVTG